MLSADVLPSLADTATAFGTGRANVRRVPRENLWIVYQVADDFVDLLAVRDAPPVPEDE